MPAVSKAQKNFFALALKVKKGELPASEVSDELAKAAKEYDEKEIKSYAETDAEGLPDKVSEDGSIIGENSPVATPSSVNGMGSVRAPGDPGSQASFSTQETGSGDSASTSTFPSEDEEDELLKLKATVLSENVLSFEGFLINESNKEAEQLNEGEITVDVPMKITYGGSMFGSQAKDMGDSEQDIATMMAADIGLVSGHMQWDAAQLVISGLNSDMEQIVINQTGEYSMYGGPYSPKMDSFSAKLGKKNVSSAIKKAFKSYGGWEDGEDLGRTDIWGGITNGKKTVKY